MFNEALNLPKANGFMVGADADNWPCVMGSKPHPQANYIYTSNYLSDDFLFGEDI